MADLNPLIRVRKHVVEQKQKHLADLYRQSEELEQQKENLEDQLGKERQAVDAMDSRMLSYFGPYAEAVRGRVESILDSMNKLETRIQIAREDMRSAFAELKKIEITQRRRKDAERKEIDKKESAELDEIGIERYRRNQDED